MLDRVRWALRVTLVVGIVVALLVSSGPVVSHSAVRTPSGPLHPSAAVTACSTAGRCASSVRPDATVHDLGITSLQTQAFAGLPITFTATPPFGANLTSLSWWFGDGASVTNAGALSATYAYPSPGLDYVYASGVDTGGTTHDNFDNLLPLQVLSAHVGDALATVPDLSGHVLANSSGGPQPTALIGPGGSVTVSVVALAPPRAVATLTAGAGFAGSAAASTHATLSAETLQPAGTSQVTLTFDGGQPAGLLTLTYWEQVSLTVNGSGVLSWNNYTFSVGVGMGGADFPRTASANPGQLTVDQLFAPYTFDPAIDYETSGLEALMNVYQTLIAANGSQTGSDPADFVPEIATCVPGSALCSSLYSSTLVSSGQDFTFVISHVPQFYDPGTGSNWGVYPTDVVFSVARTLAFSTSPCFGCNNGWIIGQALLSSGSGSWDGGLHAPLNSTPGPIFGSMTVNGTDCPAAALSSEHGCVTFHANANGKLWPEFLALIAGPAGGSITPCGWFSASAQGAGLPYWTEGNVSGGGDHPCEMPGVGGFGVSVGSMPSMGWDQYEINGGTGPFLGNTQYAMAGSGPYYASQIVAASSYTLQTNPAYAQNPDCTYAGCQPAAGSYIGSVLVSASVDPSVGPQAVAAGTADFAEFPRNGTSTLPTLAMAGLAGVRSTPSLQVGFHALNLAYDPVGAQALTGITYTAPSTFLSDVNLRQFLIHSFSYSGMQADQFTAQGLQYRFPYGGAIPSFMDGNTPTNVSWPSGDPDPSASDVGSAAWWWNLTSHDSDAGLSCQSGSPCTFPVPYVTGDSTELAVLQNWSSTVSTLSGGAIVPLVTNVSFFTIVIYALYYGPYANPFPVYPLGWAPDFADPTDYVTPIYQPDSTFTYGDAVAEQLALTMYNSSVCRPELTYYSSLTTPIPDDCQGAAYAAMSEALPQAASLPNGAMRNLLYDEVEQVAERLGLYASNGQLNTVSGFAGWIDPESVTVNPVLNAIPWYQVRDLAGPASPLSVRGPLADLNPVPAGQTTHLDGLATGGSPGYAYSWTGLPPGCFSTALPSLTCAPTSSGSYLVTLNVADAGGALASSTLGLVVGTPGPLSLAGFTVTPGSVPVGTPTTVAVATSGGTFPFHFDYTGLPPGCASVNAASFACTPTAAGVYSVGVIVNDSVGASVQATATLTVTAATPFSATLSVDPLDAIVDAGTPYTLTLVGTGGALPIHGTLTGPGTCGTTSFTWTTARLVVGTCIAPTIAGTYNLSAILTDALGLSTQVNGTLVVNPAPSIHSLGPAGPFDVDESASLSLAYSGGTGPYTISYTNLPPGCTGGNVSVVPCQFTQAGTYTVGVTLTDRFGLSTTHSTRIVVAPALVLSSFVANPASLVVGTGTNLTVTATGGSAPFAYSYPTLPPGCTSTNVSRLACVPTGPGSFTAEVNVTDGAGVAAFANVTVVVTAAESIHPTPAASDNSLLLYLLLFGVVLVAVVAVVAYVILRRRPGGGSSEEPPSESPAEEAPPEGTASPDADAPVG